MTSLFNPDKAESPAAMEANYQRYLVKVCMLVGLPVLGYFMIYDFIIGRYLVGSVLAMMFFILLCLFFIMKKPIYETSKKYFYTYFITVFFALFGLFLIYTIGFEGQISRMPWTFLYAVCIFFAFGATNGVIWTSVLLLILICMTFNSTPESVTAQGSKIRFYIAFLLVIVASFFFERLKKKYQRQLMENQQSLKDSENRYREAFERLNHEINSRQQVEAALRESEESYRALVENMQALICRFLPDGTLSFVNSAYCQYFDKTREELVGKNFFQFIPKNEQSSVRNHFESLTPQKPVVSYEHQVVAPDGKIRWQRWTDHALFDASGELQQYQSIGLDITESKITEQALRESEERFRELAELMPETIFEMTLDGTLTYVNRNAYNYFGYTRTDVKNGLNSLDVLIPEDSERAAANMAKIVAGEKAGTNEYTALRKDGSTFPVLVNSAPIFKEGQPIGLRGFIIDNTDRKMAEQERRKLEIQFQQAQRFEALGTLAGGIAHDFNNLLMNIQGNTSLMLCEINTSHPHFKMLKNIQRQVKSGAQLTRQMLGYARKGKFNVKSIELNQVTAESAETFGRTRKEIIIERDFADHLFPIEADRGQIEQVLLNLFVNAADAMPGGGNLYLKTKNVSHVNIKSNQFNPRPGNYVQLTISDTGSGMDQATLEHIFDPFFTTKEMGRGTGLGLASVYGIIKGHDGYIDVASEKGQGTTFGIYLPATQKAVKEPAEAAATVLCRSPSPSRSYQGN